MVLSKFACNASALVLLPDTIALFSQILVLSRQLLTDNWSSPQDDKPRGRSGAETQHQQGQRGRYVQRERPVVRTERLRRGHRRWRLKRNAAHTDGRGVVARSQR